MTQTNPADDDTSQCVENKQQDADEIYTFLQHFSLSQYESALRQEGFDNLQIIRELEEDVINELITDAKVNESDIKAFRNAINAAQNGTYNANKKEEFKYEYKKIEWYKKDVNKTIMFIGESGAGKTTAINSMCNYLCNIQYNDKFRYKLIDENENKEDEENKTQIQTQNINTYYLNSKYLSKINYSLTVIDTPGFGNIENDIFITAKFKKCFEEIKFIDAIYFVVKATDTRLSDIQKYIIKKLLNLFDDSFRENMFILFTFSDGSDPPAIQSIEKLNVKYNKYLKINNSGFTFPENNKNEQHKMYFNLGMKQFEIIFNELNNIKRKPTKKIVENLNVINKKNRISKQTIIDLFDEGNSWFPDTEYWKLSIFWGFGYIEESKDSAEVAEAFQKLKAYKEQIGPFSVDSSRNKWWNNEKKSIQNKGYKNEFANILKGISSELLLPLRQILNVDIKKACDIKQKYIKHKLQFDYCNTTIQNYPNESSKRTAELSKYKKELEKSTQQLLQSVSIVEGKVMDYVNQFVTFVEKWKSENIKEDWCAIHINK